MLKGLTPLSAAEAVGGRYTGSIENENTEFSAVVTDSRLISEGCLFVAIKGERADGHDFIPSAVEKGALCCLSEHEIDGMPCIVVGNTVAALQRLAAFYRSRLGVKVIGITGSVGKTTCKEVLAAVLEQKYNVHKTKGNFNNEIGLPLTLLSMSEKTEIAVIEMGMSDFGEMELLSSIAKPDMCVITNIGHSHMENLGSREGILQAKCEIFKHMAADAPSFLNGDDDLLRTVRRDNLSFFGFGEDNDLRPAELEDKGFEGSEGVIHTRLGEIPFSVSIPGRHVLYPVMAAVGVGQKLGLTAEEIARGLASAQTIGGRVNIIHSGGRTIIDDCYNAAPASMKAGLDLLVKASGQTAAVLGDMGELGPAAPELHREVGEYAAGCGIGLVIAVGELAKYIAEGCGGKALYYDSVGAVSEELENILPENCTVLIKASHFMGFDKIVKAIC